MPGLSFQDVALVGRARGGMVIGDRSTPSCRIGRARRPMRARPGVIVADWHRRRNAPAREPLGRGAATRTRGSPRLLGARGGRGRRSRAGPARRATHGLGLARASMPGHDRRVAYAADKGDRRYCSSAAVERASGVCKAIETDHCRARFTDSAARCAEAGAAAMTRICERHQRTSPQAGQGATGGGRIGLYNGPRGC